MVNEADWVTPGLFFLPQFSRFVFGKLKKIYLACYDCFQSADSFGVVVICSAQETNYWHTVSEQN